MKRAKKENRKKVSDIINVITLFVTDAQTAHDGLEEAVRYINREQGNNAEKA